MIPKVAWASNRSSRSLVFPYHDTRHWPNVRMATIVKLSSILATLAVCKIVADVDYLAIRRAASWCPQLHPSILCDTHVVHTVKLHCRESEGTNRPDGMPILIR